ncbi:MAG: hypothetical protein D6680_18875 [Cyanobacteria bacterium J007]|nr:MAG: hypothetical protein D6680_18875 [Cyanobacteria bacterium J007]
MICFLLYYSYCGNGLIWLGFGWHPPAIAPNTEQVRVLMGGKPHRSAPDRVRFGVENVATPPNRTRLED